MYSRPDRHKLVELNLESSPGPDIMHLSFSADTS